MAHPSKALPPKGIVSFFSGCGILDLGFERNGFHTWIANEYDPSFAEAYEFARKGMSLPGPGMGPVVRASIETFFEGPNRTMLEAAMVGARRAGSAVGFIGGPPCPDFSIAGKQAGGTGDRGRLTQDYFDLIGIMRPDFFLFENVKGLLSTAKHKAFLDIVLKQLDGDGYAIKYKLVNAIDFGAPQDRSRIIVVGFHRDAYPGHADAMARDINWTAHSAHGGALGYTWPIVDQLERDAETKEILPHTRFCPPGMPVWARELTVQHWFNVNDVLNHPNARDTFAVKKGRARMRTVKEGDTSKKSFKRLHRWRYSPTAAYGNNEVHLHPYLDRRLSAAEAMAIQTLPPEFILPPTMTLSAKFKTIGNGVPLKLAEALARTISTAIGDMKARPIRLDPSRGRTPLPSPSAVVEPELELPFLDVLIRPSDISFPSDTAAMMLATESGILINDFGQPN